MCVYVNLSVQAYENSLTRNDFIDYVYPKRLLIKLGIIELIPQRSLYK